MLTMRLGPDGISLIHSGTKGMKHGVRNYQNPDGTWTELGKQRRRQGYATKHTNKDVVDVFSTLSKEDFGKLDIRMRSKSDRKRFLEAAAKNNNSNLAKRVVVRDKNKTPVTILEANEYEGEDIENGKEIVRFIAIDIATRAGDDYRGKGYATKAGKEIVKWFDEQGYKEYDHMEWWAKSYNTPSQKTAERIGFHKINNDSIDKRWVGYSYKSNNSK